MLRRREFVAGLALVSVPWSSLKTQGRIVTIPVELTKSRITLTCTIAGQGPFRFIIDTGGIVSLIELETAKRLGLRQIGTRLLGMAGGQSNYPIFEARDVVLGGVARQPSVALAGTDSIQFEDGLIGSLAAGLLTASDSELDFDALTLKLFPNGGPTRDGWVRHSNAIQHQGLPNGSAFLFADIVVDGQALRCGVDTGYPQPLRVTAQAARRMHWDSRNWSPGRRGARIIRAGALEFGGVHISRPIIAVQSSGNSSEVYGDGLIGLPLIRRFNLATDVTANALFTRPNSQPAQEPFYNMAGLWFDRSKRGATIGEIGKGSPAEAAGLSKGDRVEGNFDELIQSTAGPPGTTMPLRVMHDNATRDVVLTLKDYL